jgi:hypothetical protein
MNFEPMTGEIEGRVNPTLRWLYINAFAFEALIEETELTRGRWWLDYFYEPNALSFFAGRWSVGLSWRLGDSIREARKRFAEMRADVWGWIAGERFEF